jgi:hypothetical protein
MGYSEDRGAVIDAQLGVSAGTRNWAFSFQFPFFASEGILRKCVRGSHRGSISKYPEKR